MQGTHIHTCARACIHTCRCEEEDLYVCAYTCRCIHIQMHTHTGAYTYRCEEEGTCIYRCTRVHIHIHIQVRGGGP